MKTTFKRATALLLSLLMVFSVCSTALVVYAAEGGESNEINYVSLGDSMSNGYGLPGYDGNTGVEDYGDGAYGNLFAEWLGTSTGKNVNHAQLAMSAMRAEDLHWLLELDYTDAEAIAITDGAWDEAAWNAKFSTGDYWTWNELCDDYRLAVAAYAIENAGAIGKITDDEAAIVAKYYQDSVKNADIISLGMGNGNFGVFAFGRIMEAIGFGEGEPKDALIYKVENAIRECDPELQAQILELKADLYSAVEGKLGQPISANPTLEALANTMVYTGLSYVLNYAGSVEAMLQLNPDAEIILVALMNTYKSDASVEGITMGDVLDAIFIPLNAFIAALPTYMQATQNSVYADAKFYYAEAPMVECLVNEYGKDFYDVDADGNAVLYRPNEDSIIRDRFVQSIVGYCDHTTKCADVNACNDYETGLVWGLIGNLLGLVRITKEDIFAYEELRNNKLAFATSGGAAIAKSVSVYLAFENAIIDAAQSAPVTIDSVLGLGNLDPAMFGGVIEAYEKNVEEMQAANHVQNAEGEYEEDAYIRVASNFVDTVMKNTVNGMDANALISNYRGLIAAGQTDDANSLFATWVFVNSVSGVRAAVRYKATALKKINTTLDDLNSNADGRAEEIYNGVVEQYMTAYTLLATPDALSAAVNADPTLNGLCNLFARCVIGNGLGAHPSQKGHDALFEAVKNAYVNDITAADKTFENIYYVITTYYDDAYAYAYDYAVEQGYIDAATDAIDAAIAEVEKIGAAVAADAQITAEFRAEFAAEIAEIVETLEAAKTLLTEADVLDQASLDALVDLLNEAAEAILKLEDLAVQAGIDVNQLAIIPALKAAHAELVNNIIPAIVADLKKAVEEGTKMLLTLAADALEELAEQAVDAAIKFAPELDEMLYDYFYNNPEEVIGFFAEYGYIIADLAEKYGEDALGLTVYILYTYGEDIAAFFMDNHEAIFEGIVAWADKYGDRTAQMLQVYAEALGLCDAVRAEIAVLEEKLAQLEAQLEEQLDLLNNKLMEELAKLEAELEDLYAQLEAAAEPYKAAIEAKIAEIQAKIEQIKQAIEDVKAIIADLQAAIETVKENIAALTEKLEALIDALYNLDDALKNLVEAGIEAGAELVQVALDQVAQAVVDLLGVISEELAENLDALIEAAKDLLDKAYQDAIQAEYAIDSESAYVALGDGSVSADLFAAYLAELVAAEGVHYDYPTYNLTEAGSKISAISEVINNNLATIASADLISVGYSYNAIAEETIALALDLLFRADQAKVTEFDWVALVGEDVAAVLEEKLAELYAAMVEQGLTVSIGEFTDEYVGVPVADAVIAAVEYFAYYAVEYAVTMPQVVYGIQQINPEALIMINGLSNPLSGTTITVMGEEIAFGDYLDYLVDATNVEGLIYAVVAENVVFVPASDAETTVSDTSILTIEAAKNGLPDIIKLVKMVDAYVTGELQFIVANTEAGNAYVAEQMKAALIITVDTTGLLGDVNGDGAVTLEDAMLIRKYVLGAISETDLNVSLGDVNGNGSTDLEDVMLIRKYILGAITEFPAE